MKIASIVEGHGEVQALPLLLRRIGAWRTPEVRTDLIRPIRVNRDRFLNRPDEFQRHLLLAAARCGPDGWVLVLLDADDDCAAELGATIRQRAGKCLPDRRLSVVLANREYEAWFIAAAASLHEQRGFSFDPNEVVEPEAPRDARGWLRARMAGRRYGEITDQSAFSASMDLQQAHARSRSFRKLCMEWNRQVGSARSG